MRTIAALLLACIAAAPQTAPSQRAIVTEYAAVVRADGTPVIGLSRDAFMVTVDGQPVPVEDVAPAGPMAIALVLDATSSMRWGPNLELSAGLLDKQFLARLRPGDRVQVFTVSTRPFVNPGLTGDLPTLRSAVREALKGNRTGPSPIWDTVRLAAHALGAERGPRVILLSSDGRATGNTYGYDDALYEAAVTGAAVNVIAAAAPSAVGQSTGSLAIVQPDRALSDLAMQTGGAFFLDRKAPGVGQLMGTAAISRLPSGGGARLQAEVIFERLMMELQRRYALRFSVPADGQFHRLRVSVNNPNETVRARSAVQAR